MTKKPIQKECKRCIKLRKILNEEGILCWTHAVKLAESMGLFNGCEPKEVSDTGCKCKCCLDHSHCAKVKDFWVCLKECEPTQDSWEVRFMEEFGLNLKADIGGFITNDKQVKDFISNELLKQRQEIIQWVKENSHFGEHERLIVFADDLLERLESK
jgi:hypothetical protein